jgi:hypothetical protein
MSLPKIVLLQSDHIVLDVSHWQYKSSSIDLFRFPSSITLAAGRPRPHFDYLPSMTPSPLHPPPMPSKAPRKTMIKKRIAKIWADYGAAVGQLDGEPEMAAAVNALFNAARLQAIAIKNPPVLETFEWCAANKNIDRDIEDAFSLCTQSI